LAAAHAFSVELHWKHGFPPILQSPKSSGGLGNVGADGAEWGLQQERGAMPCGIPALAVPGRRAEGGRPGAGVPARKGHARRGNRAHFLLKTHSTLRTSAGPFASFTL